MAFSAAFTPVTTVPKRASLEGLALVVEALERSVRWESLRRVHDCIFGMLALESEPVDLHL